MKYSFQKVADTSILEVFPSHNVGGKLPFPQIRSEFVTFTKSLTNPSISRFSRFHLASKTRQSKPHRCSKPCSFKVSRNFVSVVFNKGGSQLPVQKSNWLPGTCHKKKKHTVSLEHQNGMNVGNEVGSKTNLNKHAI